MKYKKTILYVDDSPNQLKLMKANLEDCNIQCYTANNGLEGFNAYIEKNKELNMILTDIQMPMWDGFDLLNHVRLIETMEKHNKIRIVSLSGSYEESAYYIGLGFDKHLTKPASIETILEEIYRK